MTVVGLDAGGTRTVCLLADDTGAILAEARGPGANLQTAGEAEVERVLRAVIAEAIGDRRDAPAAICLGMAGVDRPRDSDIVRTILARLDARARALVVNDALIALEAGVADGPGIVLIAGTGSIAYGRNGANRAARAGGWGSLLGDEGSGYWLGRQALRAVVRAADGRGPATALTPRVLAHFGVAAPPLLVREIYHGRPGPGTIAALAPVVPAAALDGDPVAARILDAGAAELAAAVVSVATRLALPDGPVVLSGGTLLGIARLRDGVVATLSRTLPRAEVRSLTISPAAGAVRLALALARGHAVVPDYADSW